MPEFRKTLALLSRELYLETWQARHSRQPAAEPGLGQQGHCSGVTRFLEKPASAGAEKSNWSRRQRPLRHQGNRRVANDFSNSAGGCNQLIVRAVGTSFQPDVVS